VGTICAERGADLFWGQKKRKNAPPSMLLFAGAAAVAECVSRNRAPGVARRAILPVPARERQTSLISIFMQGRRADNHPEPA